MLHSVKVLEWCSTICLNQKSAYTLFYIGNMFCACICMIVWHVCKISMFLLKKAISKCILTNAIWIVNVDTRVLHFIDVYPTLGWLHSPLCLAILICPSNFPFLFFFLALKQATIFGAWWICSYDLHGQETTKANKQESTAYPHQQAKVNLRGPIKASG